MSAAPCIHCGAPVDFGPHIVKRTKRAATLARDAEALSRFFAIADDDELGVAIHRPRKTIEALLPKPSKGMVLRKKRVPQIRAVIAAEIKRRASRSGHEILADMLRRERALAGGDSTT